MTTYVVRNGKLVEKELAGPPPSSVGGAAYVISDTQPLLWHPVTGKYTDSKSTFRQMTVAAGCRELGNDVSMTSTRKPIKLDKRQRVEAIQRAIHEIRNR